MGNISKKIQTTVEYGELTELEEKLIALALVGEADTVTGWARAAGCSRQGVYDCLGRSRFVNALRSAAVWELWPYISKLLKATVDAATEGDSHPDRKLLFELLGIHTPRVRAEVTGEGGQPIAFDFRTAVREIHMEQARLEQGAGAAGPSNSAKRI